MNVRCFGFFDAQTHIRFEFLEESFAQFARGAPGAFASGERRGVHAECHAYGRRFDANWRKRFGVIRIRDRLADINFRQAGQHDDFACLDLLDRDAFQTLMHKQFRDFAGRHRAIVRDPHHVLRRFQDAREQSSNRDASLVIVIRECRDEELRGLIGFDEWRGQIIHNRFEKRLKVNAGVAGCECGCAPNRIGVDNRKFGLIVIRAEINEQVEGRVRDVIEPRVRAIHFVDDDDGFVSQLQRFA